MPRQYDDLATGGLRRPARHGVLLLAVVAFSGCAAWKPAAKTETAPAAIRREDAIAKFEAQRDVAQYQAALASWSQGNAASAQESLTSLLARSPGHRDGALLLAEIHLLNDQQAKAREVLARCLLANPQDATIHARLAEVLSSQGRNQEAAEHLSAAERLDPSGGQRAKELGAAAQVSDADVAAAELVNHEEQIPPGHRLLAKADDALLRRNTAEARSLLLGMLAAAPEDQQLPVAAGVLALRREQPELAAELLKSAAARFPNSVAIHRNLGAVQYRLGDYAAAQTALAQALSLDNSSGLSYFLMGCTLQRLGKADSAATHLRQAATLDSRFAAK